MRRVNPIAFLAALLLGMSALDAGDILRGGVGISNTRTHANAGVNAGADAAAKLQANAKDRLSRTTAALDAVKAMQLAARNAAAGRNQRIADPNQPGKFLPRVKDGLGKGGLQVDPLVPKNLNKPRPGENPGLWTGARLPTQTSGKGGEKNVTIVQTDQQALLNWRTFNIGKKTSLYFDQTAGGSDASKWVAFNKINDPSGRPSQILGSIKSEGQVYVINQNGIIFGGASQVNVHTLVASGLAINDHLIAQGLLNNPTSEFLFDNQRLDDIKALAAAGDDPTLSQILDPRSDLEVVADVTTVTKASDGSTKSAKSTLNLVRGKDYNLVTDQDRHTTLVFTDAGRLKIEGNKSQGISVTINSMSASYLALAGDVVVQPGATLSSPTSAEHVGGRVMLVGAKVKNSGTISTPDGQTILAAGLQVGVTAHSSDDPSLRGLDVYVGVVGNPSSNGDYAGRTVNTGLIDATHADVTMAGKNVRQLGVIDSTTSVTLNGRIDLLADYGAVSNPGYDPTLSTSGLPFAFESTGQVSLGEDSVTRILPEVDSTQSVIGTKLPIASQINMQGKIVHLEKQALVLAPNAAAKVDAGYWNFVLSSTGLAKSNFVYTGGQIYLDTGALIDVAGTTVATAPISENILTLQFRGAELSNSPLQRDGVLRATDITVDIRNQGTFNGTSWVGTPLADVTGFAGLIQRTAAELTTAGGSVQLHSGGSVILQSGSTIDVSGGVINYEGGMVETTRVISGSQLIDIADATPDRVYDGIYDPKFVQTHSKWGVTKTYSHPLALSGKHYESGYLAGRDGGSIDITAPSMAIDGNLAGNTTVGTRQLRDSSNNTVLPGASKLSLTFQAQDPIPQAGLLFPTISPTSPQIVFKSVSTQRAADDFALDADGNPVALRADRTHKLILSPDLVNSDGFGSLTIDNSDGDIVVPNDVALTTSPGGSITMKAANIDVRGDITAPGGSLAFTAYDFSPYETDILLSAHSIGSPDFKEPKPDASRGLFTLEGSGSLSTAGLVVDDRFLTASPLDQPIEKDGGSIAINAFSANLEKGAVVDVSGGVAVSASGKPGYGDAGSISILTGQDPNPKLQSLLGGNLKLDATLKGYSGAKGGSLAVQAPLIRIGTDVPGRGEFNLSPNFFSQGGFSSFTLTGLGTLPRRSSPFAPGAPFSLMDGLKPVLPNHYLDGLVIEPGTTISPVVKSLIALPFVPGSDEVVLQQTVLEQSLRPSLSLAFAAKGATDAFDNTLVIRGDLILGEGASIEAGPAGSVALSGDTVDVLGRVTAPGGAIKVSGAKKFPVVDNLTMHARTTVHFGPSSELSTAGAVVLTPDPFGRRTGTVLPGGSIDVGGNIVAESGALFDVSGASSTLDLSPATAGLYLGLDAPAISATSGVTAPLFTTTGVATRIDSDGGAITFQGGEELFVDATLRGAAGGPSAVGGSLSVSSDQFVNPTSGVLITPMDPNLIVSQSGSKIPGPFYEPGQSAIGRGVVDKDGKVVPARGYFTADSFLQGGFDSLTLGGIVKFVGPVEIAARQKLSIASGGVLIADGDVDLSAPYVVLGTPFQTPLQPGNPALTSAFTLGGQPFFFRPKHGDGSLTVHAKLIDIGNLSLRNIGTASLVAENGDIRGDGTLDIAGHLYLEAGQIYPASGVSFTIAAYDYRLDRNRTDRKPDTKSELKLHPGSITIAASGSRQLPLSAGGELNIYATKIFQDGVVRAPLGTINLGWNSSGDAPKDLITGKPVETTSRLVLGSGSETSVSAVDPVSGKQLIIPYGIVANGDSWIDPAGIDITAGGLPTKSITLSAGKLITRPGSLIDISGGGNLLAYQFVAGQTGTRDILASETSFAVIPGFQADYAPYAPFNQSNAAQSSFDPTFSSDAGVRNPGYMNSALAVGDQVRLGASEGLPAGTYTLLPARYALLPGAVLVTPQTVASRGTLALPDGSSIVSGFRFNDLNSDRTMPSVYTRFEVVPGAVLSQRARYDEFYANRFFRQSAKALGGQVPRLPMDAGHLVFEAVSGLDLRGSVDALVMPKGIGAYIDISSPGDIVIAGSNATASANSGDGKPLVLSAGQLTSFGAESLLIGGIRTDGADGTTVNVTSSSITLDNAGDVLSGPEVILVASQGLTLAPGADIEQTGEMGADAQKLLLNGDGVLLRVSSDPNASIARAGVTSSATPKMTIGRNATISGKSLILDSSYATSLSVRAELLGDYVSLDSGQISLRLNHSGPVQPTVGLVLAGQALRDLQGVQSLSLLSYSSIDIYGAGGLGIDGDLALHAGEVRGFDNGGGKVVFSANTVHLDNSGSGSRPGSLSAPTGTLQFDANTIILGAHGLFIDQYANLNLNANHGLFLDGKGRLITQGDLTAKTPVITASGPATQKITALGNVSLLAPKGATAIAKGGVLGSSLTIQGNRITANSDVILPSGLLTLHATSGDINIGGNLEVNGSESDFFDVIKYTDAGKISLEADHGSVNIARSGSVSVAAQAGGGNAGTLSIVTPEGNFNATGALSGTAGKGGRSGSFSLDVGSLEKLAALDNLLNRASFNESRTYRVRAGDIVMDGTAEAHTYNLSADSGAITIAGTIDASGATGGSINLVASGSLTLLDGSKLTVVGDDFDAAGKGGAIFLEAGAETNGAFDTTALLDIRTGSEIDLDVATNNAASAGVGNFTGTLHLRAPQNSTGTDLQVAAINGTIKDASSIIVEGYKIFDLNKLNTPGAPGTITTGGSGIRTAIQNNGIAFIGTLGTNDTPGTPSAGYAAMLDRLLAGNPGLDSVLSIRPGAELINRSGNITLGSANSSVSDDWDLETLRFGDKNVPGILTMRASDNLVFFNALQDGFDIVSVGGGNAAYTAPLLAPNPLLPMNAQSWSYNLTAGADFSAADFHGVRPLNGLADTKGSLLLGKNAGTGVNQQGGNSAQTSKAIANRYQVIRTGSGDIDISAGRDVQLLNQFATIYTAGTLVADPTMGGNFDIPDPQTAGGVVFLGASQQNTPYVPQYSLGGGNVSIAAQGDIIHLTKDTSGKIIADSERELPINWLYRRGYVDPATGLFGVTVTDEGVSSISSTTWWVDFSNFFEGVGALGGGNVTLVAGHDISNVDAVAPTNARMPKGKPDASALVELGGGDVTVRAGHDIDGGVYYVERGHGVLEAGNSIHTNSTRSPSLTILAANGVVQDEHTWLPTTLFLGKGSFDISARGDLLLGPVANPFLLPAGVNNSYLYKTYFSTYAATDSVNVTSLGGSVTLREGVVLAGTGQDRAIPTLEAWLKNISLLTSNPQSASFYQPWLRLSETSVIPFTGTVSLMPPTLAVTAFSGDINVAGDLTLTPAARGNLDLAAAGSINGLQIEGVTTIDGLPTNGWGSSRINLSDASPAALPRVETPFAYQAIVGNGGAARQTGANDFLNSIDQLFAETGSTDGVIQTKQALHAQGLLHADDPNPVRLYAQGGDISGLTLFSGKFSRVIAGNDITDIALYVQNVSDDDITLVSSGRDIVAYDANTPLRALSLTAGNTPNLGEVPLAGDIQISGPGTLEVLAGRNLDLGTGAENADGTGTGITSVGNARNPFLVFGGARIIAGAGIGISTGLASSVLDFQALADELVTTDSGLSELTEALGLLDGGKSASGMAAIDIFNGLPTERQAAVLLDTFYLALRDAGRKHIANLAGTSTTTNADGSITSVGGIGFDDHYADGFAVITALFGTQKYHGDITLQARDVRTKSGGDIDLFAPGGKLSLASVTIGNPLAPPGVITESGGNISIFTQDNVDIGIGRIFTLRGGNEIIWSSAGDIAAGSSAKTVASAPPTRVLIDPQSADVQTDLAGLATGGGIGVLATVEGVPPGDVDLIAPIGVIDAGDAGIRATGNVSVAATAVLNASNIAAGGQKSGVATAAPPAAPNIAGLTAASNTAGAANQAANDLAKQVNNRPVGDQPPSVISADILGYGDEDDDDNDDDASNGSSSSGT